MSDTDPTFDETIRQLSALFATAYLRLCFPDKAPHQLDSAEMKSTTCDSDQKLQEQRR